ncbi:hypothetical protein ALC57_03393 [Trachymyrmex cornetzi]|uniref:Uncharacterized protein n=1 Tax=Trachymyrmex cornetzi TaxID=471704 RepID=A0A195EFW3_9HYME|nr:hypothetical protein ALC57_03393 [Trachymyrmex cornetzi]
MVKRTYPRLSARSENQSSTKRSAAFKSTSATIAFRPVTVRSGLIRAAILDAITPEIFLSNVLCGLCLREHAPLGQTRHTWGRRKNSQRVKPVRKTVVRRLCTRFPPNSAARVCKSIQMNL